MTLVATQVKRRRGTTAENDAFTGAEGEIVVDTERHELRVHDGVTQGGFKIGGGSGALVVGQILEVVGTADYTPEGCLLADGAEYTKAQFPDLWANFLTGTTKLQTCTYTEYANQIAEYGFCNKFAVDTTNETFKVPTRNKYRKLVKKIVNSDSWANLYDDGWCEQGGVLQTTANSLTFPIEMADTNYQWYANALPQDFGNFRKLAGTRTTTGLTGLANLYGTSTAHASAGVWDAGSFWQVTGYTTIPDSTSNITREFVVVANGTLNQEQMDWSAWASSLAGRATTDMNNITSTGKETVVGWGMPDYTAGISLTGISSPYVAPADGIIYFERNLGSLTINGTAYVGGSNQTYSSYSNTILVNKGDSLSWTNSTPYAGTFYPMKGV